MMCNARKPNGCGKGHYKKQTAKRELRSRSKKLQAQRQHGACGHHRGQSEQAGPVKIEYKNLREHDAGGSLHPHAFFAESDEGRKYAALMRLMGR